MPDSPVLSFPCPANAAMPQSQVQYLVCVWGVFRRLQIIPLNPHCSTMGLLGPVPVSIAGASPRRRKMGAWRCVPLLPDAPPPRPIPSLSQPHFAPSLPLLLVWWAQWGPAAELMPPFDSIHQCDSGGLLGLSCYLYDICPGRKKGSF